MTTKNNKPTPLRAIEIVEQLPWICMALLLLHNDFYINEFFNLQSHKMFLAVLLLSILFIGIYIAYIFIAEKLKKHIFHSYYSAKNE